MDRVVELTDLIQGYADRRAVLGASLAILDGDEIVFAQGFGLTDTEQGRPVMPSTLFGLGSIAKTILATLILRLVDAGRLRLDVPVIEYLPGFSFSDVTLGQRVTLRHLLSHTSGLPAAGKDWGTPDQDALARFAREQASRYGFIAEPGRVHLYSNTAITLAGYVAEVVTGRPYRELVRDLVCVSLGMGRTTYEHAVAMTYPLALPHDLVDGELRVHHRWADNPSGDPSSFLFSSAVDLAQLGIALVNDGRYRGQQFLSAQSVAQMQTPIATIPKVGATHPFSHLHAHYGLGLRSGTYRGEQVVHHGGISQSFNNSLVLLPGRRRGFVLLTNWSAPGALIELVLHLCNHLLDEPNAGIAVLTPPPSDDGRNDRASWPDHVGEYLHVGNGRLIDVVIDGDCLAIREGDTTHRLVAVGEHDYWFDDPEEGRNLVSFLREAVGPTEYLYLAGEPYRRISRDPAFAPNPATWERFAGTYRDPSNLDPAATIVIRCEDGQLLLVGEGEEEACVPFAPDAFLCSWGLIEFVQEEDVTEPILVVGKATRYQRIGEDPSLGDVS